MKVQNYSKPTVDVAADSQKGLWVPVAVVPVVLVNAAAAVNAVVGANANVIATTNWVVNDEVS